MSALIMPGNRPEVDLKAEHADSVQNMLQKQVAGQSNGSFI